MCSLQSKHTALLLLFSLLFKGWIDSAVILLMSPSHRKRMASNGTTINIKAYAHEIQLCLIAHHKHCELKEQFPLNNKKMLSFKSCHSLYAVPNLYVVLLYKESSCSSFTITLRKKGTKAVTGEVNFQKVQFLN